MKDKNQKKIKLLVVTPYFYPKIGGLENYAYNISKGLMKDYNCEIVVITSNHENPKEYKEENLEGMKIYRLPRQFKLSNTPISLKWRKQINDIIEKEKPDVINAHSPVPFISDVACRVAHNKEIPFLLTYHSGRIYKKNSPLTNIILFLYKLLLQYKTFKQSTKIISVSDFVKLQFDQKIQNKTEIVYNSISKDELKLITLKNKIKNSLIFLSNLDKAHDLKGLSEIIISIKFYIEKFNEDIKLFVIGNGDYKQYYEKLVNSLNINKNVVFYGSKFGEDKDSILRKSNLLITYPKESYDAFPTVFLEAWAKKVPIIASSIGTIPYLINDKEDGFLVEPNNPIKLSEGINSLLNNKKLQDKIIENGYKKVKENFTWDISTKKMNQVIIGVLK